MRIIIFFDSYNLGGAEKHALKLADYFKNTKGYEVAVWVMEAGTADDRKALNYCNQRGIPTAVIGKTGRLQRFLFYKQIRQFAPRFRSFKPDVIISFNLLPNLVNGLIAPFAGAKCNVWSQQSVIAYDVNTWVDKQAVKNISCFISNSQHGMDILKNKLHLPGSKCFVVHNGIEEPTPIKNVNTWLHQIGIGENDFKATMTANLHSTKDHITLIKAWKIVVDQLAAQNRKAYLVLPGRLGNTAQQVLDIIFELDLYPYIKLLGSVTDISGLNHAMDLGILSSPAEGMPNGLMENMKAGLPVIGTAIDGIKEVVGESNYGYLSPVGDEKGMAENILRFANNAALAKQTGAYNKLRINNEFSLDKMCLETEKIILSYL